MAVGHHASLGVCRNIEKYHIVRYIARSPAHLGLPLSALLEKYRGRSSRMLAASYNTA